MIIDDIKTLIGVDDIEDTVLKGKIDKKLNVILKITENHFTMYTGVPVVPSELNFIITELVVRRYNRLSAEGIDKMEKEGFSITYDRADFSPYDWILRNHFPDRFNGKGGIKFL